MKTVALCFLSILICLVTLASGQGYAYEEGRREGMREGRLVERIRDDERRLWRDEERLRRDERVLRREERRYGYGGW